MLVRRFTFLAAAGLFVSAVSCTGGEGSGTAAAEADPTVEASADTGIASDSDSVAGGTPVTTP